MASRRTSLLHDGELVRVFDVCCSAGQSAFGESERATVTQIVLPRRGVFFVQRRGEVTAIDTNAFLVLGRDDLYRVSHPTDGGDDTTVLVFTPELLLTALGSDSGCEGPMRPAVQLALMLVRRGGGDELAQLEREELCMLLLRSLGDALSRSRRDGSGLGPAQRLRVQRARALLASDPAGSWNLSAVARGVDCSPFHLARQFRSITGETIARYLLRLRLAIALERLAEGEDDLMRLACELGFAHHSHFSARFRDVFGLTPSAARELSARRLRGVTAAQAPTASPGPATISR
jgi:AraC family transcriptional regulator